MNKLNIKRNITTILLILTIGIVSISGIGDVYATDFSMSFGNTTMVGVKASNGYNGGGTGKTYTPVAYGYRITFVDPTDSNKTVGHSFDYWSNWKHVYSGSSCLTGNSGVDDYGWNHLSKTSTTIAHYPYNPKDYKLVGFKYYKTKYNKTSEIKEQPSTSEFYNTTNSSEDTLVTSYVEKINSGCTSNDFGKYIIATPSGADKCYNNNYSRFAMLALQKAGSTATKDYSVYAKIIKDCGLEYVEGNDEATVAKAKDYIMIIEPLTAIRKNNNNICLTHDNYINVGTLYELYSMGVVSEIGGWIYDRYDYINAVIYNSQAAGGVSACADASTGSLISNLGKNGCSGAATIIMSGVYDPQCPEKIKKAYETYSESSKTATDKSTYNTAVDKACDSSDCEWLKIDNYEKYGADLTNIDSCSIECESFAQEKAKNVSKNHTYLENLKNLFPNDFDSKKVYGIDGLNKFGITSNAYCGEVACDNLLKKVGKLDKSKLNTLYSLYPQYNLLKYDTLMVLNDNDEAAAFASAACDSIPICSVDVVKAKCDGAAFTISDAKKDDFVNGGKKINNMDVTTFASITADPTEKNCLNTHVAYNMIDGEKVDPTATIGIQSSIETIEYGTIDNPATCWEEVTFDLPNSVGSKDKPIIAGNVFRWGKDDKFENISSTEFGTMTIRRICTITKFIDKKNLAGGTTARIGSEWANVINGKPLLGATVDTEGTDSYVTNDKYNSTARINPNIKVYYEQALPSIASSNRSNFVGITGVDLNVELATVSSSVYARKSDGTLSSILDKGDYIDYTIDSCKNIDVTDGKKLEDCMSGLSTTGHPRRTSISSSNENFENLTTYGGVIESKATYNIVYNDNFKWYSDSKDNYKLKQKETIENEGNTINDAQYVSLGYGFPTSFVTPTKKLGVGQSYGYDLTSETGNGSLYVKISQIGTKNSTNPSDNTYHFDKLIDISIDDDDFTGSSGAIVYSCGYEIKNFLYGNECQSDDCSTPKCTPGQPGCNGDNYCPNGNCTPKGLDVVFRTVELINDSGQLDKAFPGRTGQGRDLGFNWGIYDDDVIAKILRETIYDNEPLYKINLDTVLIQDIRTKNNDKKYTDMSDYIFSSGKKKTGNRMVTVIDAQNYLRSCESLTGTEYDECYAIARQLLNIYTQNSNSGIKVTSDMIPSIPGLSLGENGFAYFNVEQDYTYAASPFITELIKNKKLTGKCAMSGTTEERAKAYAATGGCIQAE